MSCGGKMPGSRHPPSSSRHASVLPQLECLEVASKKVIDAGVEVVVVPAPATRLLVETSAEGVAGCLLLSPYPTPCGGRDKRRHFDHRKNA